MKTIIAIIKYNFELFFIMFCVLLSAAGIVSAMSAAKIDQYDNPFLVTLPLSNILWLFLVFFLKNPNEYTEEELAHKIELPDIIPLMIAKIIFVIIVFIFLADFTMMLFIMLKTAVIPVFFFP